MTPKEKAEELVHKYRMLLMNADTDCGEEILVSILSVQSALIAVDEILNAHLFELDEKQYWQQVKQEIEQLWHNKQQ